MTPVHLWRRLLVSAAGTMALILTVAVVGELTLIGRTDRQARERWIGRIRAEVAALDATLGRVAQDLAGRAEVRAGMTGDRPAIRRLFDVVQAAAAVEEAGGPAITIYDARDAPRAWTGRGTALGPGRVGAHRSTSVDADRGGLRLVHAEPVVDPAADGVARRLGAVVVEQLLSSTPATGSSESGFLLPSPIGRVMARPAGEAGPPADAPDEFEVTGADGRPLLTVTMRLGDVAETRARWRDAMLAWALGVLAVLGLAAGALALATREPGRYVPTFAAGVGAVAAATLCLWVAATPEPLPVAAATLAGYRSPTFPAVLRTGLDLLLLAGALALLVALVTDLVNQWRWSERRGRREAGTARVHPAFWMGGGASVIGGLLVGQHLLLGDAVEGAAVNLMHTALTPFDPIRVSVQLALVLSTATAVWTIGLVMGVVVARWPAGRRHGRWAWLAGLALVPVGALAAAGWVPVAPALAATGLALLLAWRWRRLMTWFRHTAPPARLLALAGAVLLPVIPLYLALVGLTDEALRRQIEEDYARQTAEHPYDLQAQLARTQAQIDRLPNLAGLTAAAGPGPGPARVDTDRAFGIWQQTALAAFRLTSSVELYDASGALTSRFALNIPEYAAATTPWSGGACEWSVFGEVSPFGSEERRTLHAERAICGPGDDGGQITLGGVVVHVAQVDYESLGFISGGDPYVELFESADTPMPARGHGVELVIYGWGLQPTFVSDESAWPLDEALFQRIYPSRTPFWTRLWKDGTEYAAHITNDRAGIYVLGSPVHTAFDHLLHLSELAILVLVATAVAVGGALLVALLVPALRRQLAWREIRARFALKLQLWFLGVATVPAVVVAALMQGYFADQIRDDVEAGAARTAAVAQSVIEEAAVLQATDGRVIAPFSDEVLVWISQVVSQDVNLFQGAELLATSERDLYASGLLSTRTPDVVYRAIYLDQLPSFVGEDAIGALRYQLAAAPVRLGGDDVILTVPLASRQQEIERQIDELNRRVWGSMLFFLAVVGVIGWVIARDTADPVRRLTRATSRVARGEFSAPVSARRAARVRQRVAEGSADELDVLEADFIRMAGELETQRRQLERTHRLEAWSEMARQVAHEIKNPLTPVQLNAEHLRRVHEDRGAPLSPVLEQCVAAILKQVRILRQIAAEFSSYASSPVADPTLTAIEELVEELLAPYRPGLEGRVQVSVEVPAPLPRLRLDRVLIQRALTNIIENALHAMPGEGRLTVWAVREGDVVVLRVADTGVGLEPEALARIFEPYFSTKVTGTGLGMAIAKRNVELNDGTIEVASRPGEGTTVTITLPVPPAAPSD